MRKNWILGGVAALLVSGALVALQNDGGGRDATTTSRRSSALTAEAAYDSAPVAGSGGGASFAAADQAVPAHAKAALGAAQPRVVKTADLTVSVGAKAITRTAERVAALAAQQGGFVAGTERRSGDDDALANITLRVPAAAYDATLVELRKLGDVSSESLGGKDVTGTLVDLDARIRSLRAQENALNALLAKANTVGETLQVAQAAGEVRTQIEQLAAQQAQLSDQADFATITVRVVGPSGAVDPSPQPDPLLVKSAKQAVGGTLAVLGGVLIVLGYGMPLGLLVALCYGVWRVATRRRDAGLGPVAAEA